MKLPVFAIYANIIHTRWYVIFIEMMYFFLHSASDSRHPIAYPKKIPGKCNKIQLKNSSSEAA